MTRKDSADSRLSDALRAAGLAERVAVVERSPRAVRIDHGLHAALAGIDPSDARRVLRACVRKGNLPEPLRLAHLIARALVLGESRGRV